MLSVCKYAGYPPRMLLSQTVGYRGFIRRLSVVVVLLHVVGRWQETRGKIVEVIEVGGRGDRRVVGKEEGSSSSSKMNVYYCGSGW